MSSAGNLQGFPKNSAPVVDPNTNYTWTTAWLRFMMTMWARTGAAQGSGIVYTGVISAFGSATIPAGWLLCDGSAVDREVYAALFSVIGTVWGAGNGTTTFNLPALTNRTLIGYGTIPIGSRGGLIPVTGGTIGYGAVAWMIKT
jgi:hypothetical protein